MMTYRQLTKVVGLYAIPMCFKKPMIAVMRNPNICFVPARVPNLELKGSTENGRNRLFLGIVFLRSSDTVGATNLGNTSI